MSRRVLVIATVACALLAACGDDDTISNGASPARSDGSSIPTRSSSSRTTSTAAPVATSTPATSTPASSTSAPPTSVTTTTVTTTAGTTDRPSVTTAPLPPPPPPSPSPPPPPPQPAPPPPPTVPQRQLPPFAGTASEIGPDLADRMTGVSWHEGCPVPLGDLRLLHLDHVGFDGHRHRGQLVVHAEAADAVIGAFRRMYEARFPIERVTLVDDAGGDDDAAMAANLTTAFNCRAVTGGSGWSEHSSGRAIDINPLQNPYVTPHGTVLPPGGRQHLDRNSGAIGMIVEGGPAVAAFDAVGWQWGGRWRSIKDYQHFSSSGR